MRVDIEAITIDCINKKGQYEVEFEWACPKCEKINREHVEKEHVISVVNVRCKKCRCPGYAVMPMSGLGTMLLSSFREQPK